MADQRFAIPDGLDRNYPYNTHSFTKDIGSAAFGDDELLDGLSPTEPHGIPYHNLGGLGNVNMGFNQQGLYNTQHHGISMDQPPVNGFSSTPPGDPIQSPFVHSLHQYGQMSQHPTFGGIQFAGSPLTGADIGSGDTNFINARARMSQTMQRKASNTQSPLTPKGIAAMTLNTETGSYGTQPIRAGAGHHEKSHSGQWIQTPNSMQSFPGSGFSSPLQAGIPAAQISDMMLKGTSMPAKLGAPSGGHTSSMSQQEVKRKRRRESHNLVERRRRDNINERIQDLSKLVPSHRLEDEKIRKAIQNGTPLSPTIGSISSPTQATSGLAGPGARRAAGGTAGNITTGLPLEDKDKGPNKGDILNGAVSWTRDLMWMLHLKIQQQEELMNALQDHGGVAPFEVTEDERRMQTELTETMARMEETTGAVAKFSYSRTAGSGLRVPHHTDYKGEPLNGHGIAVDHASISPGVIDTSAVAVGVLDNGDYYDGGDILDFEDDSGDLHDMNFKEEDEFGMDLTH